MQTEHEILQQELEHIFSSFRCLRQIESGTLIEETEEEWAEIELELAIQKQATINL